MAKRAYPNVKAGETVYPAMDGYRMACCDCGLVHTLKFEVVETAEDGEVTTVTDKKYRVAMRVWRNNRSTTWLRKRDKHEGQVLGQGVVQ